MSSPPSPDLGWVFFFGSLLAAIAIFPLIPRVNHWWEHNRNKLLVSGIAALGTLLYYGARDSGFGHAEPGWASVWSVIHHAILEDYVPFVVLLFGLYAISGGVRLSGDIPAHPLTNTGLLGVGTVLASFVGTTGASMLLIRPLLQINSERHRVQHTVIFFIFLVSNVGGALLPVGDPPLFLGYLRGVPFLWTLNLFWPWLFTSAILLSVYFLLDTFLYRREASKDIVLDESEREPFRLQGWANLTLLVGVVLAVALLVPDRILPGTNWKVPHLYLREIAIVSLTLLSFVLTPRAIYRANEFTLHPNIEVACLFVGIFVTMQVPVEILKAQGADLNLGSPMHYYWATGILSSVLDNAPTYIVFFELAGSTPAAGLEMLDGVATATGQIPVAFLIAISCGAVFMGALTYIGNGPNFLVKTIAERQGIRMPSFFGYAAYSALILGPILALVAVLFVR